MKNCKRHIAVGKELPNKERIWTLGEKETYRYSGILEADTNKQEKMKEKLRQNASGEPQSCSILNNVVETLSKE